MEVAQPRDRAGLLHGGGPGEAQGRVDDVVDHIPPDVPLVSGTTATVTIRRPAEANRQSWFGQLRANIVDPISDLLGGGPPPRANCLQGASGRPETDVLPYSHEPAVPSAKNWSQASPPALTLRRASPESSLSRHGLAMAPLPTATTCCAASPRASCEMRNKLSSRNTSLTRSAIPKM
jgi:hypothetical protein